MASCRINKTEVFPTLKVNSQAPFGDLSASYTWFKQYYQKSVSEEELYELAKLVIKYQVGDDWLSRVINKPGDYLHQKVTELAFLEPSCPAPVFKLFCENYSVIKKTFSEELVDKLLVVVGEGNASSVLDESPIEEIPLDLIVGTLEREEDLWKDLHQNVAEYICEFDEESWAEMLRSDNVKRKIFNIVAVKLVNKVPPNYLWPALANFIAIQLEELTYDLSSLNDFWNALPVVSQKGVAQDVLDKIKGISTNKNSVIAVIDAFPELFVQINLSENAKTCVKKLLLPLLSGSEDKALDMINVQLDAWTKAIKALDDETREQLVEFLEVNDGFESALSNVKKVLDL